MSSLARVFLLEGFSPYSELCMESTQPTKHDVEDQTGSKEETTENGEVEWVIDEEEEDDSMVSLGIVGEYS